MIHNVLPYASKNNFKKEEENDKGEVQNKTLELGTCLSVAVCYSKNCCFLNWLGWIAK